MLIDNKDLITKIDEYLEYIHNQNKLAKIFVESNLDIDKLDEIIKNPKKVNGYNIGENTVKNIIKVAKKLPYPNYMGHVEEEIIDGLRRELIRANICVVRRLLKKSV